MENLKENSGNLTGRSETIDNFIIEIRLNGNRSFKWIPYNQLNEIEKIGNNFFATWKDENYCTILVNLKYLFNSQNITTNELHNEVMKYSICKEYDIPKVYGTSQDPDTNDYILVLQERYCKQCGEVYTYVTDRWCKPCQIQNLKGNFRNWTSGNEKIDDIIREMQIKINNPSDGIFEWITYDQFSNIKEMDNTIYSALWKDGPLYYYCGRLQYTEVKIFESRIYGISQNPDTREYFVVLQNYITLFPHFNRRCCVKCVEKYTEIKNRWCKTCQIKNFKENFRNWASGNETIDELIQEMQLKIDSSKDIIFEWIPYNQFSNVKNIENNYAIATWNNGPLYYSFVKKRYTRNNSDKIVSLEYLLNSHELRNNKEEIKHYLNSLKKEFKVYGFSQNPDTGDYMLVIHGKYCEKCGIKYMDIVFGWCKPCQIKNLKKNLETSGNEKIDNFIQEMQLKINDKDNIIFEWIPYNQFSNIKEINSSLYSAKWNNGPLCWSEIKYKRDTNRMVNLKYLHNSQYITIEFLRNEVQQYIISFKENKKFLKIYGISRYPYTKDYVLVLQDGYCEECGEKYTAEIECKWCKQCQINQLEEILINRTSENEKIDEFIQKMQLKIDNPKDTIFEWISYNQFVNIKKVGIEIYSALWGDGPLIYNSNEKKWTREQNKEFTLKYLYNSQNMIDEFLNKVEVYGEIFKIYGISQDPDTKDYIMVLQKTYDERYCEKCIEKYTEMKYKWCKLCQINHLKAMFINWTSENEKIDEFIQEIQLKINIPEDIVFEWISYDQFDDIKEIGKTIYSALWKMVRVYNNIFKIYGITQNPDSKDYVMVFENSYKEYAKNYCETCIEEYADKKYKWCKPCHIDNLRKHFTNWSGDERIDEFIQEMQLRINNPNDMVFEWIPYNQFKK
ncbi:hypothetical protein RclHR1_01460018 [Rhizophagus clarus]|uniref:Uncharacterized protein n=1 Tax=Rhizophagus clarus TaxID=94130 RepID=A0A2Z6R5Q5_9GLOM|nr:hypothetical protein RclHR1_01460018 [Rhizophagus clarus]